MYLKRLEIQGFKSFAQKTTLEFARGMTAIVGPNGSGKSNVSDSLRWVLGEQSAKLLRGKKSDDVIFAGSEKKGKMGFAEVVATFDNEDRRIPVDAPEVSIGRRVDRSGESDYLINGQRVRLLDIVDLVLRSNIGTSRYTVIGQGTIDQMVLAGPSEVKNLLDEASGVKTYQIKRDKTLRRLETTAENLMRAEDIIAEIEPRLKSLRRQAKRMEARAEVETELRLYQREYFGSTYWTIFGLQSAVGGQLQAVLGERHELETRSQQLRQYLDASSQQTESPEQQQLKERGSKLEQQRSQLLESLSLIRGKVESQKTGGQDAASLQAELMAVDRKIQELARSAAETRTQHAQANERYQQLAAELTTVSAQLEALFNATQQPAHIDWAGFDRQVVELEFSLQQFASHVEQSSDLGEVQRLCRDMVSACQGFAQRAKQVSSPQSTTAGAQLQLREVSGTKERLQALLSQVELELSKREVELKFFGEAEQDLSRSRLNLTLELERASSGSRDQFLEALALEEQKVQAELAVVESHRANLSADTARHAAADAERFAAVRDAESELRRVGDDLSRVQDRGAGITAEKAKYDTQMEVLCEEIRRLLGEAELQSIAQQPVTRVTEGLEDKILKLRSQLDMIGGIDELTMQEYRETETRFETLTAQVEDLRRAMEDLRSVMEDLDEHIKKRFTEAFNLINEKFEYYFRVLFNGGRAHLSPVKSGEDPDGAETPAEGAAEESEAAAVEQLRPEEKIVQKYERGAMNIVGIDIRATPPGKKLSSLQALSGGERSLTSIALLCSLLTCFPSPFVVLDEVDAALDDANTIRFGQILGTLAHQTQFVTITHNRETMSQSSTLYGITMGDDGMSRLLSVKLEQAAQYAK